MRQRDGNREPPDWAELIPAAINRDKKKSKYDTAIQLVKDPKPHDKDILQHLNNTVLQTSPTFGIPKLTDLSFFFFFYVLASILDRIHHMSHKQLRPDYCQMAFLFAAL